MNCYYFVCFMQSAPSGGYDDYDDQVVGGGYDDQVGYDQAMDYGSGSGHVSGGGHGGGGQADAYYDSYDQQAVDYDDGYGTYPYNQLPVLHLCVRAHYSLDLMSSHF